jgi:hypothetical protein
MESPRLLPGLARMRARLAYEHRRAASPLHCSGRGERGVTSMCDVASAYCISRAISHERCTAHAMQADVRCAHTKEKAKVHARTRARARHLIRQLNGNCLVFYCCRSRRALEPTAAHKYDACRPSAAGVILADLCTHICSLARALWLWRLAPCALVPHAGAFALALSSDERAGGSRQREREREREREYPRP